MEDSRQGTMVSQKIGEWGKNIGSSESESVQVKYLWKQERRLYALVRIVFPSRYHT